MILIQAVIAEHTDEPEPIQRLRVPEPTTISKQTFGPVILVVRQHTESHVPAIRLVPKDDEDEFPYAAARRLIEQLPNVQLSAPDCDAMIAAGRRMGWPAELIKANEELAARGNCISFEWRGGPVISGTLYEDNVFFSIVDDDEATLEFINCWADQLDVDVFEH